MAKRLRVKRGLKVISDGCRYLRGRKEVLLQSKIGLARVIAASEELYQSVLDQKVSKKEDSVISPAPGKSPDSVMAVSRKEVFFERRKVTNKIRFEIFDRDDYRCVICGADAALDSSVNLDVDHIIPVSKGGKSTPENLRTLCSRCNNGKGAALFSH